MKDVIVLDKNSQRKIYGGKACELHIKNPDGTWTIEHGYCDINHRDDNLFMHYLNAITLRGTSFCHTESNYGQMKLTSNDGKSRC